MASKLSLELFGTIRLTVPSFQLADQQRLCRFQRFNGRCSSYSRKIVEKLIESLTILQIVKQSLERNAGAAKDGNAAHGFRISDDNALRIHLDTHLPPDLILRHSLTPREAVSRPYQLNRAFN